LSRLFFFSSARQACGFAAGLVLLAASCSESPRQPGNAARVLPRRDPDPVYFSAERFSRLTHDSLELRRFLGTLPQARPLTEMLLSFYRRRHFQYGWLEGNALQPGAQDFYLRYQEFIGDYPDTTLPDPVMDSLLYHLSAEGMPAPADARLAELDIRLSLAFFRVAGKEFSGIVDKPESLNWYIPRYKKNYPALLDSLASGHRLSGLREPASPYYLRLKSALARYRQLEKPGVWPLIPDTIPKGVVGRRQAHWLRRCLVLMGDLAPADTLPVRDSVLVNALKRYQMRMGLTPTGIPDVATLGRLRVPLQEQIRQIMVNLERMRWLPEKVSGDFLLVNIPAFTLHVFRKGRPAWESRVVVGRQMNKTQVFRSKISHVIVNPSWAVPPGIIRKEVLPGIKRYPGYLGRHRMEVFSGNRRVESAGIDWGRYSGRIPYTIRQVPGYDNPLGRFKFLFPSSFWIYLHGSSEPWRFGEPVRTFSHGCIRVEKAEELASLLLAGNAGMSQTQIRRIFSGKKEAYYRLNRPEPVFVVYLTAWADEAGTLHFRPDVYGRDPVLCRAVFGGSCPVRATRPVLPR
jgi:murein L,D-transpeptidase YcbB/YkuD